ncbi:hypothetical protein LPMP_040920 [Leishmania panamensis]|uniref:Uncharacterized protein n=1 Tax=Leishmania panamensis TaxID=5679 RepID=A0A088RI06_LEIPA|nr:hypothetical protein LPMP_040920 [Leishmania panamensis]AIN95415.1 hypothetical protein LPMP_040920 [Leishmania panamensis]
MPGVVSRDYRASWEIPYDFHPRIHAYPRSASSVRVYMNAPLPALTSADAATAPEHQRGKRALRHYCIGPRPPAAAAAVAALGTAQAATTGTAASSSRISAPVVPQQPKTRTGRRPGQASQAALSSSPANDDSAVKASPAGVRPPTPPPLHTSAQASGEECDISAQRTGLHPARSPATPCFTDCRVPQRPISAAVGVVRRLPSSHPTWRCGRSCGAQPPNSTSVTAPATAAAASHTPYHHRTKPHYSLRPSYAAYRAQWRRRPVPIIRVADEYRTPPAAREYRLHARQVRHASRENFVEALVSCVASGGQEVVPHGVVNALTDTRGARSFDPSLHNYNVMVMDAFHDSVEERAARLQATENRMWERMILNVAPLEVAHQHVVEAGGVSVLDSGHVSSPICISSALGAVDAYAADLDGGVVEGNEAIAVVVRPFPDELLGDSEALRVAEAQRRWPKGREWDRQTAIQRAVGATAQEAIIDLGIDPRYRHPGDRLVRGKPACVQSCCCISE